MSIYIETVINGIITLFLGIEVININIGIADNFQSERVFTKKNH